MLYGWQPHGQQCSVLLQLRVCSLALQQGGVLL